MRRTLVLLAAIACLPAGATAQKPAGTGSLPEWWVSRFPGPETEAFARAHPDFDEAYRTLALGPDYPAADPGVVELTREIDGMIFRYTVLVPPGYDPSRRYPVQVFLHGGIMRDAPRAGGSWWRDYDGMVDSSRIAVFPAGWREATWWGPHQAANLEAISQELRRRYNVDENRFHLAGISDGGTGVWFHAFRSSTTWAGFLAYIGHPAVLNNPRADTDGELFATNLTNRPFFVVNGEVDRLYPTVAVVPYIEKFRQAGVDLTFRPQAGGGHDMRWAPDERDNIRAFISTHPRNPLPDQLTWETERTDRYQRHHWLIISGLGVVEGETEFGSHEVFAHRRPSGRVDLVRTGNTVSASTHGVTRFTLLLSPDQFDFFRPIKVITNGATVYDGMVSKDMATLIKWAAHDRDRTMLFAAELNIEVVGG